MICWVLPASTPPSAVPRSLTRLVTIDWANWPVAILVASSAGTMVARIGVTMLTPGICVSQYCIVVSVFPLGGPPCEFATALWICARPGTHELANTHDVFFEV